MAEDPSEPLQIDWSSAEVHGSALEVALVGELSKDLRKRAESLIALIEPKAGRWGEIQLRKAGFVVADVQEGAEPDLRHLLESVVTQLNADLGRGPDGAALEQPGSDQADGEEQLADRHMRERFAAFAEQTGQRSEEGRSDG